MRMSEEDFAHRRRHQPGRLVAGGEARVQGDAAAAPRPGRVHLLGRRAARLGRADQLRGVEGRPGRAGPVAGPRARLARHHLQRGGARLRRDRHDRRAARGPAEDLPEPDPARPVRRRSTRSPTSCASSPATRRRTSPVRSSPSTAAWAWVTRDGELNGHPGRQADPRHRGADGLLHRVPRRADRPAGGRRGGAHLVRPHHADHPDHRQAAAHDAAGDRARREQRRGLRRARRPGPRARRRARRRAALDRLRARGGARRQLPQDRVGRRRHRAADLGVLAEGARGRPRSR